METSARTTVSSSAARASARSMPSPIEATSRRIACDSVTTFSVADLIRESGAQGVELLMWLVMRGALRGVEEIHTSYHVPISNTAAAVMVLENTQQWSEQWLDRSLSKTI